ncbi:MAG: competence/damage-inducible protein A [Ilumatobacteraceae bacterium]
MRCDVVAIGTELLLGQIIDTNSSWIGEQLAANGIDSLCQWKVGDNLPRMVAALRRALEEADAVIVCGGLGPTHDDLTRDAIAEVMGAELVHDEVVADVIRDLFASRNRRMPENNLRQAQVPAGATVIPQTRGTAPGLICPVGAKVVYAVPGVPHEMRDMVERAILPDLRRRAGDESVIVSQVLRTWGEGERAQRASRRADRRARSRSTGYPCLPRQRVGRDSRSGSPPRPRRLVPPTRSSTNGMPGSVPSSGHRSSGSTTRRWSRWCSTCCASGGLSLGTRPESVTGGLVGSPAHRRGGSERRVRRLDRLVTPAGSKFELLGVPDSPGGLRSVGGRHGRGCSSGTRRRRRGPR